MAHYRSWRQGFAACFNRAFFVAWRMVVVAFNGECLFMHAHVLGVLQYCRVAGRILAGHQSLPGTDSGYCMGFYGSWRVLGEVFGGAAMVPGVPGGLPVLHIPGGTAGIPGWFPG